MGTSPDEIDAVNALGLCYHVFELHLKSLEKKNHMSRVIKGKGEIGKIITPFPPLTHTQDYTIYAKRAKMDTPPLTHTQDYTIYAKRAKMDIYRQTK